MGTSGMTDEAANGNKPPVADKEQVLAYLKRHPDFLQENPQLSEILHAPKSELGSGVADLQYYMVSNLQKELKSMRGKYDDMVEFCRDNMSTQSQVHNAILRLLKTQDLEQLLQVITTDLISLFNVDVVRLAMETESVASYEISYPDAQSSGVTFIENGVTDQLLGVSGDILLIEDVEQYDVRNLHGIFANCMALVSSCALLRLRLDTTGRDVILAFGVRHKHRFHPHQGVELLSFLAQIVGARLDTCLHEIDPEAFA